MDYHNQIKSYSDRVSGVDRKISDERAKLAQLQNKMTRESERLGRAKKLNEINRVQRDISKLNSDISKIEKKMSDLSKERSRYEKQLGDYKKRQDAIDLKIRNENQKKQDEMEARLSAYQRELHGELDRAQAASKASTSTKEYDFFISHASEDKDGFVRELAISLQGEGVEVWYDEFTLKVGDSLRRSIDEGLKRSRFGIVVLSKNFIRKDWTNHELDGLVSLENSGSARILPIWHEISKNEVIEYSPTLADKYALNSSLYTIEEIVNELKSKL